MKRLSCKRVEPRLADFQLGDLPEPERAAINVHLAVCDSCREVAEVWVGLPAAVGESELPPLPPLIERRLLTGGTPARRGAAVVAGPRSRRLAIGAGALAAAAAAVVIGVVFGGGAPRTTPGIDSPSEGRGRPTTAPAIATPDRSATLAPEQLEGSGVELGADRRIWAIPGSVVRLDAIGPTLARISLERGFAVVEIGPHEPEQRVIMSTPAGEIEARGTVFSVEVAASGHETIRVTEGQVEVRAGRGDGAVELVEEGQQVVRGLAPGPAAERELARDLALLEDDAAASGSVVAHLSPAPERNRSSKLALEDLVKRVRLQRRERNYGAAARSYEQMIEAYPGTRTAANALVGLGQLELSAMGRARDARSHFEAYLSRDPDGMLAEEARAGLVRALDRLGRRGELISAATEYLERHPRGGAAAEMLRRRGDARRRAGSCRQAISDYRRVIDRWSGSREAANAVAGLDACDVTP